MEIFEKKTHIEAPAHVVFDWHARPGAFERLAPPWERISLVEHVGGIEDDARVVIRMKIGPFPKTWVARHLNYRPGESFQDEQVSGPFAHWIHTHTIIPDGLDACWLHDHVEYQLPLGFAGRLFGGRLTRRKLSRMFDYRHRTTIDDLRTHTREHTMTNTDSTPATDRKKILITGGSGLVGSKLKALLTGGGHEVYTLTRSASDDHDIEWNIAEQKLDPQQLEGFDAVVHLAGEGVGDKRWSEKQKAKIRDSRVEGTTLLCETLATLEHPPNVLVSASAIGYYGDQGETELTEDSASGETFLAEVCREWEASTIPAEQAGIRVVHLRIGIVLTPEGGALKPMLLPFKMGVGGRMGSGKQYWSWIAIDDLIDTIHFAIQQDRLSGPVNGVAPTPVTNKEFTKVLGSVLHRPTIFPMPKIGAKIVVGEMAEELILASTRVLPVKLEQAGYQFRFTDLETALKHVLGK